MKIFTSVFTALMMLLLGSSCQKNISQEEEANKKKADDFKTFVTSGAKFRAVDYWAESPIDYDPNDGSSVKETDLKKYIRDYILDDDIIFGTNGTVTFVQNQVKIGDIATPEIKMPYRIAASKEGVIVDYIDDKYDPLTYMLHEQGTTYFVLSYKRSEDGVRLFSRYEVAL
jgi:hypothetical protein